MMISPETYYEEYLKGKSKEQIMRTIRGLKQEIGRLKNILESPDCDLGTLIFPNEQTRIICAREYLSCAKQAYIDAGGVYTLSKAEKKAIEFDSNIEFISRITFNIGGFSSGCRSYVIELSEDLRAYTKLWDQIEELVLMDEDDEPFTKWSFLSALKELNIGEWRRRYTTERFGFMVCDGTQWELEFEYKNGHKPVIFDGDNSYPYNFDRLEMLFGIDDNKEDEYY